jgi:hypothetical protein
MYVYPDWNFWCADVPSVNPGFTPSFSAAPKGETVEKSIRRLGGGAFGKQRQQAQRKLQQKIKKGQVSLG